MGHPGRQLNGKLFVEQGHVVVQQVIYQTLFLLFITHLLRRGRPRQE